MPEAEKIATETWDAYAALCRAESEYPRLRDNPFFQRIKADACADFNVAYERLQ